MLFGSEKLHYGGFIGMSIPRSSGTYFVTMVEVYADGRIVIPKKVVNVDTRISYCTLSQSCDLLQAPRLPAYYTANSRFQQILTGPTIT